MKKEKKKARRKNYAQLEYQLSARGAYITPYKTKNGSIGYDLAVPEDVRVKAHSRMVVPLNFAIKLPTNVEAKIEARSGFSLRGIEGYGVRKERKHLLGIIPYWKKTYGKQNFDADVLTGKIDPGYRDSVGVIINNHDEEFIIRKGTRIAQVTFYKVLSPAFVEVDELSGEDRGGGFGSTGTTT